MVEYSEIKQFIGKTLVSAIQGKDQYDQEDEIIFEFSDGSKYKMYHYQSCCESVTIEDIDGDLSDIVGFPLTTAEEAYCGSDPGDDDSHTWSFYRLGTERAMIVIRWYGTSNGYYSESVDIDEIK
ncbi:hypothetical protein D3C77_443480 [compost metagenome]